MELRFKRYGSATNSYLLLTSEKKNRMGCFLNRAGLLAYFREYVFCLGKRKAEKKNEYAFS